MIERVMYWANRIRMNPEPRPAGQDPLGLTRRCKHDTLLADDCPLCRDPDLHYVIHLPLKNQIVPCCGRSALALPEHDLIANKGNEKAATCPEPGRL